MYRKYVKYTMIIAILLCMTGCGGKEDKKTTDNKNYLGGQGEIKYNERKNGNGAVFDDENIYFNFEKKYYVKLNKDGYFEANCDLATCTHKSENCKAYVHGGEYFVFNGKLYKEYTETHYKKGENVYEGYIVDCISGDVVFENSIPEELEDSKKLVDSKSIDYVRVLSDDVLKVEGNAHTYLLDKDFNILYWYDDLGKFPWGKIKDNVYYYVNNANHIVCVDLDTFIKSELELENKVFDAEIYEGYLFYTDTRMGDLHKYSFEDKSDVVIADDITLFSLYDGYIYYATSDFSGCVTDIDGNVINEYTRVTGIYEDAFVKIHGKVYASYEDGIFEMNEDGSGNKVYTEE